jgi:hypothetical protein
VYGKNFYKRIIFKEMGFSTENLWIEIEIPYPKCLGPECLGFGILSDFEMFT